MPVYIITENRPDAELLSVLLRDELLRGPAVPRDPWKEGDVRLFAGSNESSAVSMANTALSARGEPVALVVNSNSLFDNQIAQRRSELDDELRFASPGVPWKVFVAVPELEVCVFQHGAEFVEKLFGTELSSPELILRDAQSRPKHRVRELLADTDLLLPEFLVQRPDAVDQLRRTPLIAELIEFVNECSLQEVR